MGSAAGRACRLAIDNSVSVRTFSIFAFLTNASIHTSAGTANVFVLISRIATLHSNSHAGVNAPCHYYTRFRALTASRLHPATSFQETTAVLLRGLHTPSRVACVPICCHPRNVSSRLQIATPLHPAAESSRRTPYEHALPPRYSRVFRSIFWPQREESDF